MMGRDNPPDGGIVTELVRVHRDAKGTTRWLEPALDRIRAMSSRFDGNPDALVEDVHQRFAKKDPTLGLFVGVEDDQIVGHVLAFIQTHDGKWVCWITQVSHDRRADRALIDTVLATLTDFVEQFNFSFKNHGIQVTRMLFQTPHMHDMWARHSGFTPYRYIMARDLPTGVK